MIETVIWIITFVSGCKCAGNPHYIMQVQNPKDHYTISLEVGRSWLDKGKVTPKEGDTIRIISAENLIISKDTFLYEKK